jgi:uncharacterized protein
LFTQISKPGFVIPYMGITGPPAALKFDPTRKGAGNLPPEGASTPVGVGCRIGRGYSVFARKGKPRPSIVRACSHLRTMPHLAARQRAQATADKIGGDVFMIILPVSLTIAAGAAMLNLWLAMRVGRVRGEEKISIGDGGNERVIRRMRAHGNFVENTAFVLVLLALVELGLGSSIWLWGAGALYLVARILHALGMDGMQWGRATGTVITMLTQLGLAIAALLIVYLTPTNFIATDVTEPMSVQQP